MGPRALPLLVEVTDGEAQEAVKAAGYLEVECPRCHITGDLLYPLTLVDSDKSRILFVRNGWPASIEIRKRGHEQRRIATEYFGLSTATYAEVENLEEASGLLDLDAATFRKISKASSASYRRRRISGPDRLKAVVDDAKKNGVVVLIGTELEDPLWLEIQAALGAATSGVQSPSDQEIPDLHMPYSMPPFELDELMALNETGSWKAATEYLRGSENSKSVYAKNWTSCMSSSTRQSTQVM